MKRLILALALILGAILAPLAWATGTVTGFVVDVSGREVTIVPPGWHPPMLLPPPVIVEEPVADELAWALEHDAPPRLIELEELDDNGVYDTWRYVSP